MTFAAHRFRATALAAVALAGFALAGCTVEELEAENTYVPNSGSEQFPIIVEKGPSTLSIANAGRLSPGQINAVGNVARSAVSANAPVTVSHPAGSGTRLAHEVANLLAQQGVRPAMIHMASYRGAASGPVKVTVKKLHARTSPCGEWPEDLTDTSLNELHYNHGCAVQSNIAAMVDNPEDFVRPAPSQPAIAASRVGKMPGADAGGTSGASASTTASTSKP